jgi:hypothetical protein
MRDSVGWNYWFFDFNKYLQFSILENFLNFRTSSSRSLIISIIKRTISFGFSKTFKKIDGSHLKTDKESMV